MKHPLVAVFLALEVGLYAAFLTLDARDLSGSDVWLKYAGILLCLAFSVWAAVRGGDRLTPIALTLTAAADSLLLVADAHYALGVLIFLGAQSAYLIRLRRASGRTFYALRLLLPLAAGIALYALGEASPLNLLAGLYFSQLVCNTAIAWTLPARPFRILAAGLTLFIGCDVCVGAFNAPALVGPGLWRAASFGMWLFYLPSQVLIALSALPEKEI